MTMKSIHKGMKQEKETERKIKCWQKAVKRTEMLLHHIRGLFRKSPTRQRRCIHIQGKKLLKWQQRLRLRFQNLFNNRPVMKQHTFSFQIEYLTFDKKAEMGKRIGRHLSKWLRLKESF